jgi:hypothetical protein
VHFSTLTAVLALALCCAPFSAVAQGQFNKCVGKDGKIAYMAGPCPSDAKSAPGFQGDQPAPIGELNRKQQILAHWCVERWSEEASPGGRARRLSSAYEEAKSASKEELREQRMTVEQYARAKVDEGLQGFNDDCGQFGFRKVGAATDQYNERMSRSIKQALDSRYPESRREFDRLRHR